MTRSVDTQDLITHRCEALHWMGRTKTRVGRCSVSHENKKEFEEFNASYKFGNQMGGGAPVRDKSGRV